MNIIVQTHQEHKTYCRPDTTWEKENKDIFVPEYTKGFYYTPVLFVRISKAGRCIGEKFASRYYDSIGYGMLLYASAFMDNSPMAYASASCLDHSSILPFPMYNRCTLENGTNEFMIEVDGKVIYSTSEGSLPMIEKALSDVSAITSVRIGDIVAIELASPVNLTKDSMPADKIKIRGQFCENDLFDFNIIF